MCCIRYECCHVRLIAEGGQEVWFSNGVVIAGTTVSTIGARQRRLCKTVTTPSGRSYGVNTIARILVFLVFDFEFFLKVCFSHFVEIIPVQETVTQKCPRKIMRFKERSKMEHATLNPFAIF